MKHRLLEILSCPQCGKNLKLDIFKSEAVSNRPLQLSSVACRRYCGLLDRSTNAVTPAQCSQCYQMEVIEGRLRCPCGQCYPIIGGIPRLFRQTLLAENVTRHHQDFFRRYSDQFPILESSGRLADKKVATMHAFGYQWTTFVRNFDYFREIFLSFVRPFLKPEDFRERLVLEVGCGSGRPASVASSFGAEVVAIDLSEAVQTAHAQSQHYPRLHVVQGDAYALPFRPCFDFVYSVGVIQHLPDPAAAIRSIARAVPQGHKLVVWVYGKRERWYQPIEWLRKATVQMPYRWLHALSWVLALVSEITLLIPYRILSRIYQTKGLAEKIPGRIYARFPFKENVLGWFDRLGAPVTHYFSKEDVERMLSDAGLSHVTVVARPGASASWVAEAVQTQHNPPG